MNLEKGLSTRLLHHRSTTTSSNPTTNGNGNSFLHKDADGSSSSSTIPAAGGTKGKTKSKKTWSCRHWVFALAAGIVGFWDVDDHESDTRESEKEEKDVWEVYALVKRRQRQMSLLVMLNSLSFPYTEHHFHFIG